MSRRRIHLGPLAHKLSCFLNPNQLCDFISLKGHEHCVILTLQLSPMALHTCNLQDWVPSVDIKRDPNQLTFTVPLELLALTRQILYKRYGYDIRSKPGFYVDWVDEADNPTRKLSVVDSSDLEDQRVLPSELFRTKVQVRRDGIKCITVTLYYTTGTVLVQGTKCNVWRDEEFDAIVSCIKAVSALDAANRKASMTEKLSTMRLPPTSHASNASSGQTATTKPARASRRLKSLGPDNASLESINEDSELALAPSLDNSYTPPPSTAALTDSCDISPEGTVTPVLPQTEQSSTSSPTFHGSVTPSADLVKATQEVTIVSDGTNAEHSSSLLVDHPELRDEFMSLIETAKAQIKSDLKHHINTKCNKFNDTLATMRKEMTELSKQNHTLKSQLGDLKRQNQKLEKEAANRKEKTTTTTTTESQTAVEAIPAQVDAGVETFNRFEALNDEVETSSALPKRVTQPVLQNGADTNEESINITRENKLRLSAAKLQSPDNLNPRQQLAELRVASSTTRVLLGDSVMRTVREELMFPGKASQNLSVSGLCVDDLTHWLTNIPQSKQVQLVIVHIGVNTCRHNTITETAWSGLFKLMKKVFPAARLHASSLVPPKGEHALSKTVATSNHSLERVCARECVLFTDHTDTFLTASGAPRKALYRDALHPSRQGTIRLACNLKFADVKIVDKEQDQRGRERKVTEGPISHRYTGQPAATSQRRGPLLQTPRGTGQPSRHHDQGPELVLRNSPTPYPHPPPHLGERKQPGNTTTTSAKQTNDVCRLRRSSDQQHYSQSHQAVREGPPYPVPPYVWQYAAPWSPPRHMLPSSFPLQTHHNTVPPHRAYGPMLPHLQQCSPPSSYQGYYKYNSDMCTLV